jgi:hypothetical protein
MKRTQKIHLFILSLLMILLLGADCIPTKLIRFTVVNKSTFPIEMRLIGNNYDQMYYLRIPEGSKEFPEEKVFTITPDVYAFQVFYAEYWDPVYGFECGTKGSVIDASRNVQLSVHHCDAKIFGIGEYPNIKFPAIPKPKFRFLF